MKLILSAVLSLTLACMIVAACDPSQLYDAELSLLFDDAVTFDLVPKRMEQPLNTARFGNDKNTEALNFFKTRFGIDFTNPSITPTNFKLTSGSFEGYNVYGATTSNARFFGAPLVRVFVDVITVTALDSSATDPVTQQIIPKDAIAQFAYYSFFYKNNGTQFTAPIKATSQRFIDGWRDSYGNLDYSRTITFDLFSPEWGVGSSTGAAFAPMHDKTLGKSQVSMREFMRFPPNLFQYSNTGKVTTCQSWL